MSKLTPKMPFEFSPRGGMVHDLGHSYVTEIEAIYQHLNNLRENAEEPGVEPQAHQIKITDNGKLYIRNTDNSAWVYIGEANKENLGMKANGFVDQTDLGFTAAEVEGEKNTLSVNITGNAAQIANVLIAAQSLQDGDALIYDAVNKRFVNKQVPVIDANGKINVSTTGSAGQLGDKPVLTTNIQDGEILVYRPSLGGFVNETKATGVGAKELSFTINRDIALGSYSGVATTNLSLLAYGTEVPTGQDSTMPPFWIPVEL